MITYRAISAALHTPQLEGAQDSVTTYSPEKASIPQNET